MKILLIQPNGFDPIGLKAIGAYLSKQKVDVEITSFVNEEDLISRINRFSPQFVGISVWTGSMILAYLKIVEVIKRRFPEIKIIAGGNHASLLPEQLMAESECDFVVCGDGESATGDILSNRIENNSQGIWFREGREVKGNHDLRTDSLDLVGSLFYEYPPRFIKKEWGARVVRTYSSKGCPCQCAFCLHGFVDQRHRRRNRDNLKNELAFLKERYDVSEVNFFDDNFFADMESALELCDVLKQLEMSFQVAARIDFVDEELTKTLSECGCKYLYLGIESGSDRILKLINKNITREEVMEKGELLKKYEIPFKASFMINLPTETKKDLEDTKTLALELTASTNSFSLYAPYPRTMLYDFISREYKDARLPRNLLEWGEINWFYYLARINELSVEDITGFCRFFNIRPFQWDELHKTSV